MKVVDIMPDSEARLFLSYNHADRDVAERLVRVLERRGVSVWWDEKIGPGEMWLSCIDGEFKSGNTFLACLGPAGIGNWQKKEIEHALNLQMRGDDYLVIPVILPGGWERRAELPSFLKVHQRIQFNRSVETEESTINQLIAAIRREPIEHLGPARSLDESPFPGLATFEEQDSEFFFGREAQVKQLLDKLRPGAVSDDRANDRHRFLAVVGASGSGKSSLVRAGLIPAIKSGAFLDSATWPILVFRPAQVGHDPLHNLCYSLTNAFPEIGRSQDLAALIDQLRHDHRQLNWQLSAILHARPETARIVIVVDQFEEVFTVCQDPDSRRAFIDALVFAASEERGRVIVILSLRADFYVRCAEHEQLAKLISGNQELLGPLSEDQLRDAITRPADQAGCQVEPGLIDVLLGAMKNQTNGLPLLQFALRELWIRGKGHKLSLENYHLIGELDGALDREADRVYAHLTSAQQECCRQILLRMVQLGEGHADTRRRAMRRELQGFGDERTVEEVLQTLVTSRLITMDGGESSQSTNEGCADITHETLIAGWKRLAGWIEADRDSLRTQIQLSEDSAKWLLHQRDEDYLFRGARLLEAEEWRGRKKPQLTKDEDEFLTSSITARDADRRQRELQRRHKLRLARWIAGLSATITIGLILGIAYVAYSIGAANRQSAMTRAGNVLTTELSGIAELARETQKQANIVLPWIEQELAAHTTVNDRTNAQQIRLHFFRWLLARSSASPEFAKRAKESLQVLKRSIPELDAIQVMAIREELETADTQFASDFWVRLDSQDPTLVDRRKRIRAFCVLAKIDPDNERWKNHAGQVLDDLIHEPNVSDLTHWLTAMKDVRQHLLEPLTKQFEKSSSTSEADRIRLADITEELAHDSPATLVGILEFAEPQQFVKLFPLLEQHKSSGVDVVAAFRNRIPASLEERESKFNEPKATSAVLAKRWANCAVAIVQLGKSDDSIWNMLATSPNPLFRSFLIHRFVELRTDPNVLISMLRQAGVGRTNPSIRQALLLSLGEFGTDSIPPVALDPVWLRELAEEFRVGLDPGVHSAIEWLFRRRGLSEELAEIERSIKGEYAKLDWIKQQEWLASRRGWYVNSQSQSLVICKTPGIVNVGSPEKEQLSDSEIKSEREKLHKRHIDRRYAIGMKEITKGEFRCFAQETNEKLTNDFDVIPKADGKRDEVGKYSPDDSLPMNCLTWYLAARYCNWLSSKEGLPDDELCYDKTKPFQKGMKPHDNYLSRLGYRLPTEAEWEYACRAGTTTSRYFGDSVELLDKYAWYAFSSYRDAEQQHREIQLHLGGTLKPNDFGLFDSLGSCDEWCQERFKDWNAYSKVSDVKDSEDLTLIGIETMNESTGKNEDDKRVARGGSLVARPVYIRAANRYNQVPDTSALQNRNCIGLRLARTLPPATSE